IVLSCDDLISININRNLWNFDMDYTTA
ncbi:unnamed protein product, partial [Allacma fusca]